MAEEQQLAYDGERLTVTKDYWIPRGDTRDLVFNHDLGPSTAVKAAELELKNSAGTVVVSLTLADHSTQWDFTTDDEGTVTLQADDTASITAGVHDYAVQLTDQSDRVYTPVLGKFTLKADIVDNDATSPYPSWDTLTDLELDITQMLACGNCSYLTTALAGGEGTLVVANGAIFTAADDVRVVLDSGAYEDDTIAAGGVSGNTLTLDATIAGAAAIGNIVRII